MPLSRFSAPTKAWFGSTFAEPTNVQAKAWQAIAEGGHALIVAPTGSGKTLAAFLWALDSLTANARPKPRGTRVVYVSPLKALGVDVERNLRVPLAGIRAAAEQLGTQIFDVTARVRSGDTTSRERAALVRHPPDILITTPESLYLMLTSSARETLTQVETVIVDEIHAVAGTKRGSHLALSLERLDALVGSDVQRIALSATVRPIERIAAFLGGDRSVQIVNPPSHKNWEAVVRTAVPDLADTSSEDDPGGSVWPFVEEDIFELVTKARSTLIFTNSRRAAERLTGRLNELWAERHAPETLSALGEPPPAQIMATVDTVRGAPAVIARAHHGSVSKEARAEIEAALKAGELRCVVATSSLELGIDMGAIERVIQVGSPPTVASALQRIGRAGHSVGATSTGDVFPLHRGDLAPAVVATEAMLGGRIEQLQVPRHPLDVLAQHSVAAAAAAGELGLDLERWFATVCRSFTYAGLDRALFDATIELLTGRYPAADFGDLRARLRLGDDGRLYALPGALRLAATSGGTIPDRGLFPVFLAGDASGPRRVGELDEEMVFESRVGDVITLGASAWRIEEISRDQVIVSAAPGQAGRLPFWRGDEEGRPAELGAAIGALYREVSRDPERLKRGYLDDSTAENLTRYLDEQRQATGVLPDERTVVVERFRDELGDWRIVVHCPLGRRVLGAWGLVIADALGRSAGVDVRPQSADDGIVLRLPDSAVVERLPELLVPDPEEVAGIVTEQVGGTALFAGRFRECAARALLLPRLTPGRRAPLWQQRLKAMQLLEVARHHARFPVIIETVREVTQDVYDLPGLVDLLRGLRSGAVRLVEVVTQRPSPFAASILFRYPGAFMYEEDVPLAERRAALLSMDPELLAAALGTLDLRDVLDPAVLAEEVALLRHQAHPARTAEELVDRLRLLGPIPLEEAKQHVLGEVLAEVGGLAARVKIAGREHLVAASELALLSQALGVAVPAGTPPLDPAGRDGLTQLIARYARTHGPFTAAQVAEAFGLGVGAVNLVLEREVSARRLTLGRFTPGQAGPEFIDPEVLRRVRTRSLAKARAEVRPVSGSGYARFLAASSGLDDPPPSNPDEVFLALQRLAGAYLPASAWETHILPARLSGYAKQHLDELIAEGEVLIRVRGSVGPNDPLVALIPSGDLELLAPADPPSAAALAVAEAVGEGDLSALGSETQQLAALWAAAQEGVIAPASFAAVRARVGGSSHGAHRAARPNPRRRVRLPKSSLGLLRQGAPVAGHWYRVRDESTALGLVTAWLERWGVVTRGAVTSDAITGGFTAAYRLLRELETAGKVIRGYLIEGLGAAQFSTPETIDQLRSFADAAPRLVEPTTRLVELVETPQPTRLTQPFPDNVGKGVETTQATQSPIVLAALDPANPYGSILPWPEHPSARPSRAAGALVVISGGHCIAHLTRGGRTMTLFAGQTNRAEIASLVTQALIAAANAGRIPRLRIEEIDGVSPGASGVEAAMRAAGARLFPKGLVIEPTVG